MHKLYQALFGQSLVWLATREEMDRQLARLREEDREVLEDLRRRSRRAFEHLSSRRGTTKQRALKALSLLRNLGQDQIGKNLSLQARRKLERDYHIGAQNAGNEWLSLLTGRRSVSRKLLRELYRKLDKEGHGYYLYYAELEALRVAYGKKLSDLERYSLLLDKDVLKAITKVRETASRAAKKIAVSEDPIRGRNALLAALVEARETHSFSKRGDKSGTLRSKK